MTRPQLAQRIACLSDLVDKARRDDSPTAREMRSKLRQLQAARESSQRAAAAGLRAARRGDAVALLRSRIEFEAATDEVQWLVGHLFDAIERHEAAVLARELSTEDEG